MSKKAREVEITSLSVARIKCVCLYDSVSCYRAWKDREVCGERNWSYIKGLSAACAGYVSFKL